MLPAAVLLTILTFAWLLYEKYANDRRLATFRYIVHVNGIRGKTGVCRLLDAVFREAGFRVFTKTTGSTPFYLDTSGTEHLIRRRGPANIGEQLRIIRQAASEHAEVLILECMAVAPGLQRTAQEQIVKGSFNVITNVRYDHIFEMGGTLDEIAESLAGTLPENGLLLTSDAAYFPYFKERCEKLHSRTVLCTPEMLPKTGSGNSADNAVFASIPRDNLAIAYAAAKELNLSDEAFSHCLQNYHEDFGAQKLYRLKNGSLFYNLFSANDPSSTKYAADALLQRLSESEKIKKEMAGTGSTSTGVPGFRPKNCLQNCKPVFLYNHRADRPDRLLLFARYFFPQYPGSPVLVTGENTAFAVRFLKKHGVLQAEALHDPQKLLDGAVCPVPGDSLKPLPASAAGPASAVIAPSAPGSGAFLYIGIGNIKGSAYRLLQHLEQNERGSCNE